MDIQTLIIYIALYIWGFSLMIWAVFFDKNPTKTTLMSAKIGLVILVLTLFYFFYVLGTIGIL
jgi:hypothetical protein